MKNLNYIKNVGLISLTIGLTSISSCDDNDSTDDRSISEVTGDSLIDFLLSKDVKFQTTYSLRETVVIFQKEGNTCSGDPAGSVEVFEELWSLNPGSQTIVINDDTDVDFVGSVAAFRSFNDLTNREMVLIRTSSEQDEKFPGITNEFSETLTINNNWKLISKGSGLTTYGLVSANGKLVTITTSTSEQGLECEIRQVWDVTAIPQESITTSIRATASLGVRG